MANLANEGLDPNVKENTGKFQVIPAAWYIAVIVGDNVTDTKNKDGKIWELEWQIIKGEYTGFKFPQPDRINIRNKSTVAQAIGQGTVKHLCNLTQNQYPPTDTTRLFGKPVSIKVDVEEFESNKEAGKKLQSNKITAYRSADEPIAAPETKASTEPAKKSSW